MAYIPRTIEPLIQNSLKLHPVIVLTGPRQVGKSTLLQEASFLKRWRYLTLDDQDVLLQAREDPKGLLLDERPTIIDEVQRHPELLLTVKYYVDQRGRKRQFILSGSGNIALRQSPRETLAGRARYFYMAPLSHNELVKGKEGGLLPKLLKGEAIKEFEISSLPNNAKSTWRGGLPRVVLTPKLSSISELLASYIDTYLERDIQDLVKIRHPENFRSLMVALAKATGWASNQEELAEACGEERSNVSRYLSLLKETGLLYELRGYHAKGERSYRQSKFYWFDSGVSCFLAGLRSYSDLSKGDIRGRFFENLILQQILHSTNTELHRPDVYYWKQKREGGEVDFVIKNGGRVIPIEVKSATHLEFRHTGSVRQFLENHPETPLGIIVYNGTKFYQVASNIFALPWPII